MTIAEQTRRPISGEEELLLRSFGQYLSGRLKPTSIAAYQNDIRLFAEEIAGANLLQITEDQEDRYIDTLYETRRTRRTILRKSTAFRYLREFVAKSGLRGKSLPVRSASVQDAFEVKPLRKSRSKRTIDRTIDGFMRSVEKSCSGSTIRAYRSDLAKFLQALQHKTGWQCVSEQLVSDFIDEQIAAGLNANSAARLLATLRSLFRWLRQNGHVIGNPTLRLRVRTAKRRTPVPAVSEIDAMTVEKPSSFVTARALLIFELLYRCGLRVSEVSALDISSADLKQGKLRVRGPRDRERFLDLNESTVKALTGYLPFRNEIADAPSGPLLINSRGGRLTDRSIGREIAALSASGRLPEGTHPLSLRQIGAAHSVKRGKDVLDIRHDLGISGISALLKISE